MPSIAALHPQIVHFVVALVLVGVAFRIISLSGRFAFTGPAATWLIVLGTVASLAAVKSGDDAHGPVERVPGARAAVTEHEEWGLRSRNILIGVAALELVVLMLSGRQPQAAKVFRLGAAIAGLVACVSVYETAEHGGMLVYNYAGGVGLRSGNAEDVGHLLTAGLYHQATLDRAGGRGLEGAALIDQAAARSPQNAELQLLSIEWTTDVRNDPAAALRRLDAFSAPAGDNRLRIRAGLARVNALAALGNVEAARQVLMTLKSEFSTNAQVQRRLEELEKK